MTVEEMIELLDVTRREWSAYVDRFDSKEHEKFDQIIAALHAGQRMRKDAYSDEPGAQAWDAATAAERSTERSE